MRNYRPLFESFAIKDDIQQKRATRAATSAIRNNVSDDHFEDYLSIMCRPGTYGGEPELMAFVQCYDRDVLVHLPRMENYPEAIPYTNQHRPVEAETKSQLHLCYGGDEVTFPHYDSARKNTPPVKEVLLERSKKPVTTGTAIHNASVTPKSPTMRAIRGSRSDLSRDLMHDMIVRGSKDFRSSFDDSDRARSPSVSSSHHSSSSKRSFDDDGDSHRVSKRADRRKSTRIRGLIDHTSLVQPKDIKIKLSTHSQPDTPQSTQSSDDSSDQSDLNTDNDLRSYQELEVYSVSSQDLRATRSRSECRTTTTIDQRASSQPTSGKIIVERRHSTLQA